MLYDVIVVGAGPGGSTTARECASAGMSVLMLDRATFPRDKPCGGGVNVRAAKLLPFDLTSVTERTISGMRISIRQTRTFECRAPEPLTYLTQRREFDTFLAEKAVRAGVDFRQGTALREIVRQNDRIGVRSGSEYFEARSLVAADGANGPAARLAGMHVARTKGIALEGNVDVTNTYPERWKETFGIDVGDPPGGYGWLFPKGDHLNIGVGGYYDVGPTLRTRLDKLAQFYGFRPDELRGVRGHPLPVRLPGAALTDGNVLLVGDAAGLLDPLTGEGIYGAIWSGTAAAQHLRAFLSGLVPGLDGYRAQVENEISQELIAAGQLRDLFYVSPRICAELVHYWPRAWRLVTHLITGEATYNSFKYRSRGLSLGIETTSRAIRVASSLRQSAPVLRALERLRSSAP